MKKILILLLAAALLCLGCAAAEGDTLAFDAAEGQVNVGETLQTALIREGDAAGGELTWQSSDAGTASVDEAGVVTGLKKGRVTITAQVKTEQKSYQAQMRVNVVQPVTEISVNTAKLSVYDAADAVVAPYLTARDSAEENGLPVLLLQVKKRLQISATASPKDAGNRKVVLSSGDEGVFTVQKDSITGVAPGEAILTVSSESNPEVNVRYRVLVVQPVTKLTISASESSVAVGGQVTLSVEVKPENATMQGVIWSSGDERIATVDENGVVTGLKRGNGRIIATAADGSNVRANFTIKVAQSPETVTLSAAEITVDVGRNQAVKATIGPKDTDNKKVIWTSSDESVAKVSKDGRVTGVKPGDCVVTCTAEALESVTAAVTVHVQQPVKSLTFDQKSAITYSGETVQLSWTTAPADATNPGVTFSSSNAKILTVDENGLVTGLSRGSAYVNAVTTDGSNRKARIKVTVGQHVTGVRMVRENAYLDVGEVATAGATLEPKDATNDHMTWVSSDEHVVTATGNTNKKMKLKAVSLGEATVTGTTEDGGYSTSIHVIVGNFDRSLSLREVMVETDRIWLKVRNDSDLTITKIIATLEVYTREGGDKVEQPVNKKDGSNKVNLIWTGTLAPGETTGKSNWKMENFEAPLHGMESTFGTVTLYQFQIDYDWIKTIRQSRRPAKDYE